MLSALNVLLIMSQTVEVLEVPRAPAYSIFQNIAALGLALAIDFFDAVPTEVLFFIGLEPISLGYEAAVSIVEAAYLSYLQVPAVKWLAMSGSDMIPFVDVDPVVHAGSARQAVRH